MPAQTQTKTYRRDVIQMRGVDHATAISFLRRVRRTYPELGVRYVLIRQPRS